MKNMKKNIAIAVIGLLSTVAQAQTDELPRSTPEAEGIPSETICQLIDSLTSQPRTDIHSMMILRHDRVVAEIYPKPFDKKYKHTLYSCSKTFVAAAIGIAIHEKRLRLTDRVAAILHDQLPDTISDELAELTVRDLLTMTSGIQPDWEMRNYEQEWVRKWLSKPFLDKPGTTFRYDSMCTYLLSAVLQRVTGFDLLSYLKKHVFDAMNITEVEWERSPENISTGGWGLRMQPESMAKFGLLLLHQGTWNGRQLIPQEWVAQMTTTQFHTGTTNYGYQTWICDYPTAFVADGALGQSILVVPEKDLVVVMTQNMATDGARQRSFFWNLLIPAITENTMKTGKNYKKLQKKQQTVALQTPQGKARPTTSKDFIGEKLMLSENPCRWTSLKVLETSASNLLSLHIADEQGNETPLTLGHQQWHTNIINTFPVYSVNALARFSGIEKPFAVAGSYAFRQDGSLAIQLHYVDWVTTVEIIIDRKDGQYTVALRENNAKELSQIEVIKARACKGCTRVSRLRGWWQK